MAAICIIKVLDWTTYGAGFQNNPACVINEDIEPMYVLLASGLEIGAADSESALASQLLSDFVCGQLGSPEELTIARRIIRVILAGNSIASSDQFTRDANFSSQKNQFDASRNAKHFDLLLAQILSSCPVDILPGPTDPVNYLMPQQPLHPCLLPHSARFSALNLCTNPYEAIISNKVFLGHSGQPIQDILLQSNQDGDDAHLQVLENTLHWAHLAPTAPDTTACFPFMSTDPFIIKAPPDLLFSGNHEKFATKSVMFSNGSSTSLICIPSFKKTHEVVLLELSSMKCRVLSFD